jgi:hypothetical protein
VALLNNPCHFDERSEEKSPKLREISPYGRDDNVKSFGYTSQFFSAPQHLCGEQ